MQLFVTPCPSGSNKIKMSVYVHYRYNVPLIDLSHNWLTVIESTEVEDQLCIHIILPRYLRKNLECLNISN